MARFWASLWIPLRWRFFIVSFLAIFLWKIPPKVVLLGAATGEVIPKGGGDAEGAADFVGGRESGGQAQGKLGVERALGELFKPVRDEEGAFQRGGLEGEGGACSHG